MFIAALFIIAKIQKQLKCSLTDEWIKKMWGVCVCVCVYTHNGILHIKNNELMTFTATWMDLEMITLSKGSQIKTTHDIVYMQNLKK